MIAGYCLEVNMLLYLRTYYKFTGALLYTLLCFVISLFTELQDFGTLQCHLHHYSVVNDIWTFPSSH